jgi:hypothetical protein
MDVSIVGRLRGIVAENGQRTDLEFALRAIVAENEELTDLELELRIIVAEEAKSRV